MGSRQGKRTGRKPGWELLRGRGTERRRGQGAPRQWGYPVETGRREPEHKQGWGRTSDSPFSQMWFSGLQKDNHGVSHSSGAGRRPGFCWREVKRLRANAGVPQEREQPPTFPSQQWQQWINARVAEHIRGGEVEQGSRAQGPPRAGLEPAGLEPGGRPAPRGGEGV